MCHDPTSLPPVPRGGDVRGDYITMVAADGGHLAAFAAPAERSSLTGMVILPDVRGLHPFYEELALRFAGVGTHAVAIDYYGRTAGPGRRGDDFDFRPHLEKLTDDAVAMDVAAAIEYLDSPEWGPTGAVFTTGFCLGGRLSFNLAAAGLGLSGVIGFYGRLVAGAGEETPMPTDLAGRLQCPVLGLFGGADPSIPVEHVEAFRRALEAAGVAHEIVVYPDAPHSFFDRAHREHAQASTDAWNRLLRFVERLSSG